MQAGGRWKRVKSRYMYLGSIQGGKHQAAQGWARYKGKETQGRCIPSHTDLVHPKQPPRPPDKQTKQAAQQAVQ